MSHLLEKNNIHEVKYARDGLYQGWLNH